MFSTIFRDKGIGLEMQILCCRLKSELASDQLEKAKNKQRHCFDMYQGCWLIVQNAWHVPKIAEQKEHSLLLYST